MIRRKVISDQIAFSTFEFKYLKMPLSWNEIKDRAIRFSKEWETENSEDAEAKTFWDDFFNEQ
jgi:hypothetical protein